MKYPLLLLLIILFFSSCAHKSQNYVGALNDKTGEVAIKNWTLIGPFAEKFIHKKGSAATEFADDYKQFKKYLWLSKLHLTKTTGYTQKLDSTDFTRSLGVGTSASCFAYCNVSSITDQDVAFLMGIDNNATLWVNDKLCLTASSKNVTKNECITKVHLNKGNNLVVVALSSDKGGFGFRMDVSAPSMIWKYVYGTNNYSISDHYLIKQGEKLLLRLTNPDFHDTTKAVSINISTPTGSPVIFNKYPQGSKWTIPLDKLLPGVYNCRLITGRDTFNQKIIYGNYKDIFKNIVSGVPISKKERDQINIQTQISRFTYLDDFGLRNGYDQVLERKMSALLFDIAQISAKLKKGQDAFRYSPGFHIRAFRSQIDNVVNNYAVYYPENQPAGAKIPLVMLVPWVAKQHPFTESWHLAFIDRIEFLEHLANKYGFAIMWQSARVYEKYNLNPIVTETAFEALDDLQKDYNIDKEKIYLYGTCSGGLQALLLANRYPASFAAVGVEGPEISYLQGKMFPEPWTRNNNMIKLAQNFFNMPVYIANSKNDWHGAKEPELTSLITGIKRSGGSVNFDSIENATRSFYAKMVNDNLVTDQIFSFFKGKTRTIPHTIKFSTYQLKYNKAYWITINDIENDSMATLKAYYNMKDAVYISENNIRNLSVDLNKIPALKNKELKVYVNGVLYKFAHYSNNTISIAISKTGQSDKRKSFYTEGPVNHFFGGKFILVKNSAKETQAVIDTFSNNWRYNFFGDCIAKNESALTRQDIAGNNLLIIDRGNNNPLIRQLLEKVPVTYTKSTVNIAGKKIVGTNLGFVIIYPNPLNAKKYILLVGYNSKPIVPDLIKNLPLHGWFDAQVWDNDTMQGIYAGSFDRNWKLKN